MRHNREMSDVVGNVKKEKRKEKEKKTCWVGGLGGL